MEINLGRWKVVGSQRKERRCLAWAFAKQLEEVEMISYLA